MEKNCDRVQENRRRGSAVFFLPIMDDQMSVCNSVKCGHILYEFACSEIRKYGTPIFAKIYSYFGFHRSTVLTNYVTTIKLVKGSTQSKPLMRSI